MIIFSILHEKDISGLVKYIRDDYDGADFLNGNIWTPCDDIEASS